MKIRSVSIIALAYALISFGVHATDDPTPVSGANVVAAKAYVDAHDALKQDAIPAGTAGNLVTYSGTAGTVGSTTPASAPSYNASTGALENGTAIATIAAVDTMQKKIDANDSTTYPNGSVVTYGTTAGTPGQVAIATAPSYNASTGALENGTQIASIAAVNTMQRKRVCVGWATGHENDDDYCYFWDWPD